MRQRTSIGLDVHARSVIAHAIDHDTGDVFEQRFTRPDGQVVEWLATLPGKVQAVYEAGPTGYGLARACHDAGIECLVAAPSKLLPPPGSRIKTDRRDARHLADLAAAGLIVPVRVPTIEEEAARDVIRAREDATHDLMRARHRLSKMLLRHGLVYDGKTTWNKTHTAWLARCRLDNSIAQAAFDNDLAAVVEISRRRDDLDRHILQLADNSAIAPTVTALGTIRGISTLTGFALTVEIGDWARFTGASIASFVGLVPSEHSSGSSRSQGGITKTGNQHVRRLLIEAAWHHRPAYQPARSPALRQRWAQADPALRARGDQANRRLHYQWAKFDRRGKRPAAANAAVARELAGFCWSLATMTT
jgi:transposase